DHTAVWVRSLPDALDNAVPGDVRQAQVSQHGVEVMRLRQAKGVASVVRVGNIETFLRQEQTECLPNVWAVFNDEHASRALLHTSAVRKRDATQSRPLLLTRRCATFSPSRCAR